MCERDSNSSSSSSCPSQTRHTKDLYVLLLGEVSGWRLQHPLSPSLPTQLNQKFQRHTMPKEQRERKREREWAQIGITIKRKEKKESKKNQQELTTYKKQKAAALHDPSSCPQRPASSATTPPLCGPPLHASIQCEWLALRRKRDNFISLILFWDKFAVAFFSLFRPPSPVALSGFGRGSNVILA